MSCPKCPSLVIAENGEESGSEANSTKKQICSSLVFDYQFNLQLYWIENVKYKLLILVNQKE